MFAYTLHFYFLAPFHFIQKLKSAFFIILIAFRNIFIAFKIEKKNHSTLHSIVSYKLIFLAFIGILFFLNISILNRKSVNTIENQEFCVCLRKTSVRTKKQFLAS